MKIIQLLSGEGDDCRFYLTILENDILIDKIWGFLISRGTDELIPAYVATVYGRARNGSLTNQTGLWSGWTLKEVKEVLKTMKLVGMDLPDTELPFKI